MSSNIVVTFDADPSQSPHAQVSFGYCDDVDFWARVTIYSGMKINANEHLTLRRNELLIKDAIRLLGAITSYDTIACAAFRFEKPEQARGDLVFWKTVLQKMFPEGRTFDTEGRTFDSESRTFESRPNIACAVAPAMVAPVAVDPGSHLVENIVAKVKVYASQYGSHPDFASRAPRDVVRVNNYITSVYGSPLPADVMEKVRNQLAALSS